MKKGFKEFLHFLYTDDCKITAENAVGIMYLAKKYLISPLAVKCLKVLKACIKPDNTIAKSPLNVRFPRFLHNLCRHFKAF